MLLVRAPLRITLGGGGSDVISHSSQFGGFCVSAAITKYNYIAINHAFQPGIFLKYSESENVQLIDKIQHPVFREAIKLINLKTPQIEIHSIGDVPSKGSGMGASGAFCVALLKALYQYKNIPIQNDKIAELACNINIDKLKNIQGKQDEYISAIGGITCLAFEKDGGVNYYPLKLNHDACIDLEENLLLFYSNISHNTNQVLSYQDQKTKENDQDIINNLHKTKEIGYQAKKLLELNKINDFAELLNVQYQIKKERTLNQDPLIDEIHLDLLKNGAIGAKIIGSGNGGFFLVYAENKNKIREYCKIRNLEELRFQFDFNGAKQIV